MNAIIIQGIGAIGYSLLALSYFKKEKTKILFIQIIAYIFFTIHYFLLGGLTGGICNLIGLFDLITMYAFEIKNIKNKSIATIIFVSMLLIVNIMEFQDIFSIFPIIASSAVFISFQLNSEDIIRGIGLVSAVCWLIYAIAVSSYIAIAFEAITFIGVTIAFIKNTRNPKIKLKS